MKRVKSIARLTLEDALEREIPNLKGGAILDIGAKDQPYQQLIPDGSQYMSLDIMDDHGVDIVGDIHELDWPGEYFDAIIMTEVLEHLHSPHRAVGEVERLLKPGGICLLSTRFIHPYHPDPRDYYRYTSDGLRFLFSRFASVKVEPLGNRVHTIWLALTQGGGLSRLLSYLTPWIRRLAPSHNERWACGFLVVAQKDGLDKEER